MKKMFLIAVLFLGSVSLNAQRNVLHFYAPELPSYDTVWFCLYDEIHLHAVDGCANPWFICDYDQCAWGSTEVVVTAQTPGEYHYGDDCNNSLQSCCILFSSGIPPTEPWPQSTMLKCQGTLRLYAQANPQEDYTYLWSTGETTPYIDVDNLGTYGVTVTDACGNVVSDQVTINGEYPLHEPNLPEHAYLYIGGSVTLDAGTGFASYTWSNGSHGQTCTVTAPGEYWVQTVNEYGCSGYASTTVSYLTPPNIDESTPVITTDTIGMTGNNMVCWFDDSEYVSQVGIYRENLTNQWNLVGVADYHSRHYVDDVNSNERSYRYKLASIDICGNESEMGRPYQTMTAVYLGPGVTNWWVQWTPYKVAEANNSVDHYELWTADNLTDFNQHRVDEPVQYESSFGFYYVNLPHGIQDSVLFVKAYIKEQYGGGVSISNFMQNYELLGVDDGPIAGTQGFLVYPNPAKGCFTVEGQGAMSISNVLGQVVITREIDGKETIELPEGMYFIKLGNETRKIVVE